MPLTIVKVTADTFFKAKCAINGIRIRLCNQKGKWLHFMSQDIVYKGNKGVRQRCFKGKRSKS